MRMIYFHIHLTAPTLLYSYSPFRCCRYKNSLFNWVRLDSLYVTLKILSTISNIVRSNSYNIYGLSNVIVSNILILLSDCGELPLRITHLLLLQKLLLALPQLGSAVGITPCIKWPDVFRNVRLIQSDHHLSWPLYFILEPGIRHSQI